MGRSYTTKGFTLIEILVTIAILGALIALYAATLRTSTLTQETAHEDIALHVANQKLDDLRASGYASLPSSGPFGDTQLGSLPSGAASTTITTFNAKTKQVIVTVSWLEAGRGTHSVSLTTLITQVGGL